MDGGAWKAAVHGVAEGRTWLSDFTFTFHFQALEKDMATHSSVLAWRIPWTEEPGGLPSMGSHRVGHDWSDLAAAAAPKEYFQPSIIRMPRPLTDHFWLFLLWSKPRWTGESVMTLLTGSWAVTEYELCGYLFLVGGLILRSLNQSL